MITFYDFGGAAAIDGTQGSANAGILAAVMFTVSGGVVTIVGQKNVASVTRHASGEYRVTYTSTLGSANYGVVASCRTGVDSSTDHARLFAPRRNSTSGRNTYSTSSVDLVCVGHGLDGIIEITAGCVIVFDPSAVGSDYLAAGMFTVSGTTPTLQSATNITGTPRQATGAYRAGFTSTLPNSDYSLFGTSRYGDFTNDAQPLFGHNRHTSRNLHTTASLDMSCGRQMLAGAGNFDPARVGFLVRNSDVAPRGTVAAVRFSVSANVPTIIRQWNVASVTWQVQGCFRIAFTTPIADTDYMLIGGGKWAGASDDDAPCIGENANTGSSRGGKTTSEVDIACNAWAGHPATYLYDPEFVDVWVVKPWLM